MSRCLRPLLVAFTVVSVLPALSWAQVQEDEGPLFIEPSADVERERKRQAPPVLACSPSRLRASVEEGDKASLRLTVSNNGGQVLRWRIASAPSWVSVSPENGALAYGETRRVVVTVRSAGLRPGTRRGEIVVEAPGAERSQASVAVSLTVEEPYEPEPEPSGRRSRRRTPSRAEPDTRREEASERKRRERERVSRPADAGPQPKFGLRGGLALFLGAEDSVRPRPFLGARYHLMRSGRGRGEIGFTFVPDLEQIDRGNYYITLSFDLVRYMGRTRAAYWDAGVGFLREAESSALTLRAGVGSRFGGKHGSTTKSVAGVKLDMLIASENAPFTTVIYAGIEF